jgi:hypothetical protein
MIAAETLERARDVDLVATAERLGSSLKRMTAAEWAGPCPACGGTDRFAINVRRRLWNCRSCSRGGNDAISLVGHLRGLDFREAVAFLVGGDARPAPQARQGRPQLGGSKKEPPKSDAAFVSRLVDDIVREIVPMIGSPGEPYLREVRRIDPDAIADDLQRTDAIGWHPSVLFREAGHALDGKRLGCIVGVMTDPVTARPTGAISRTYIDENLRKIGKAKTLGSPAGIVRLTPDDEVLEGLHLAEGLETALDAMARGFRPIWSTGSTALMAKFPVLAGVDCLTIFADNDRNETGLIAANEVAGRWLAAGRETHVYLRETMGDLNDAFRELEG